MLSNLIVVALLANIGPLVSAQSAQYPAGINPQACPNYPICENPSVAVHQVPIASSPYTQQYQHQQPASELVQARYQPQSVAQYVQQPQARYTSTPVQNYQSAAPVQLQQRQYNLANPIRATYQAQPQYISAHLQNQAQAQAQAYQSNLQAQYPSNAQAQYPSNVQAALDRGDYIGDGDYHGEGLAESGDRAQVQGAAVAAGPAYNQGLYQIPQSAYAGAPQQYHQQPAQLPAGLAPGACPNYPFCHQ